MTLIGGWDPGWFLNATPEEIERQVEQVVVQMSPGDHFMLMPADSTAAGVPLTNFAAVRRAIDTRWLLGGHAVARARRCGITRTQN